jgi:hypothetical protein
LPTDIGIADARAPARTKEIVMRKPRLVWLIPLVVATVAAIPHARAEHPGAKSAAAMELRLAMRTLWEDHISFTRGYIVSALADLPDSKVVLDRLMKNQEDLGAAITPFYGDEAGKKLTALLKDHIAIAGDVVKAARGGDKTKVAAEQARWTANGKELAAFLAGANPAWKRADLEAMLQKHLDLTTAEAVARLNKDWAGDLKAYDEGHAHMLMFADALTDGIVKQYPKRFRK